MFAYIYLHLTRVCLLALQIVGHHLGEQRHTARRLDRHDARDAHAELCIPLYDMFDNCQCDADVISGVGVKQ